MVNSGSGLTVLMGPAGDTNTIIQSLPWKQWLATMLCDFPDSPYQEAWFNYVRKEPVPYPSPQPLWLKSSGLE